MRLSGLSGDCAWSYALWPADPETGKRSRAESVTVLDDPDAVDAFFAREARA